LRLGIDLPEEAVSPTKSSGFLESFLNRFVEFALAGAPVFPLPSELFAAAEVPRQLKWCSENSASEAFWDSGRA